MRIDIDRVNAGEMFTMTRAMKADNLSHLQPNTTVADGKATQTMMVMVDWVEDRGSFLYVGYHPVGEDRFRCTFGAARIYKDGPRQYGVIGFEGRRRIIPEEGKVTATLSSGELKKMHHIKWRILNVNRYIMKITDTWL